MIPEILIAVIVVLLFGSLPTWRYSRGWGYFPSGGISLIVLVLFILVVFGLL
jgi:hypothetical protein